MRKHVANNTVPAEIIQKFVNKAAQEQTCLEPHLPVVHSKSMGMLVVSNLTYMECGVKYASSDSHNDHIEDCNGIYNFNAKLEPASQTEAIQ